MVIVIPTANDENLSVCFSSISVCESIPPQIIVVDDGDSRLSFPNTFFRKGKKPFIFSRNVNVGMSFALEFEEDLLIMSDDTQLATINALSILEKETDGYGIVSPCIDGDVGNDNQRFHGRLGVVQEPKELCFMCVLVKLDTIKRIGCMDERFVGYGYEDIDYCRRAQMAGIKLGVLDKVRVIHKGYSVFRNREDFGKLSEQNKQIYLEKWGSL